MAKEFFGVKTSASLSSLATLSAFKQAVEKDEFAYNFDVMDLYLRCVRLLSSIQQHCLEYAPHDFPRSDFVHCLGMNAVINELFSHCAGHPHQDRLMLPDAVRMLGGVIEEEGDKVLKDAKTRAGDIKLQQTEPHTEVEPSFENPAEDMFSFEWRSVAGMIIFQGEDGMCRMPLICVDKVLIRLGALALERLE